MKTECKYENHISPYIDGELSSEKAAFMATHLTSCTMCQAAYQRYTGVDKQVKRLPESPVSNEFARELWRKIDAEEKKRRRFGVVWGWRPALAAAATVLLVIGLLFLPSDNRKTTLSVEEAVIVENLEFFSNYEVVRHLDLLEHWDEFNEPSDA